MSHCRLRTHERKPRPVDSQAYIRYASPTRGLRRRFFDGEPRRTMIAASVLDTDWMDRVEATGGPWMFVAEAVLIYLDPTDARRAVAALAKRFSGARIALDWFAGGATNRARSSRGATTCGLRPRRRSSTPTGTCWIACRCRTV